VFDALKYISASSRLSLDIRQKSTYNKGSVIFLGKY